MKKITIAALAMLSLSVSAHAAEGVDVDPTVYERVFLTCVTTFKVDAKKESESLSDLVEACRSSAQKIASRSPYTGSDEKYYVTINPIVPRVSGSNVKPITPATN